MCIIYWIAVRPKSDSAETEEVQGRAIESKLKRGFTKSLFSWLVIVWGLAGLVGGIVAIVRQVIPRPN